MAETTTENAEDNGSGTTALDLSQSQINSDVLQNIPVTISVEVGRTSLKIRDLMRLTQGSVVAVSYTHLRAHET